MGLVTGTLSLWLFSTNLTQILSISSKRTGLPNYFGFATKVEAFASFCHNYVAAKNRKRCEETNAL